MRIEHLRIQLIKIMNKKNIISMAGVLIILGLIGPWLHFSEYDQGSMYFFNMNPFYLSVRKVPNDLNLSPTNDTHFLYRLDASILGSLTLLGAVLILAGIFISKLRLSWIGLAFTFFSIIFFPTVLPIIFSDTVPYWGIKLTTTGAVITLITLFIEYITEKYEMGFPRR